MGLKDMVIGKFVKVDKSDYRRDPDPLGQEVERRQSELERLLDERARRRDMLAERVRSLRGA